MSGRFGSAKIVVESSRRGIKRPKRLGPLTGKQEMCYSMDRTQIIERARGLTKAVAGFVARAREFFHAVVLSGWACPQCDGSLAMEADGRCRCRRCGQLLDPTVTFQRCPACGGKPKLRVRRYECSSCGHPIVSRFLFDGLAFDAQYFRRKMAEHRQRRTEQRERVRQMLAGSRSQTLWLPPVDLGSVPGLAERLRNLALEEVPPPVPGPPNEFNLRRYEAHIQAHLRPIPLTLEEIPALDENARLDRIWRFIAIIFLAHAGTLDVWQRGQTIMVRQREADRERQDLPGDPEQADGVEGLVGGIEA